MTEVAVNIRMSAGVLGVRYRLRLLLKAGNATNAA